MRKKFLLVLTLLILALGGGGKLFAENGNVAKVGNTEYATIDQALAATKTMTGDVTVEIYDKVTFNQPLIGDYTSINFVGKDTDAEMYLDVQGYTTATGKEVTFTDLKLSKSVGGYVANAGFMNLAFGIYDVKKVSYNNCTFLNGACASSGEVTFNGCTFYRSHDRYGLWAYGAPSVTVEDCTFADIRGIKLWDEGKQKLGALTVKNTNFSAVTDKPAIVLTSGKSVVLEDNTYNADKGTFELDLDGNPNGTPVTSDVAPVCVNDKGACGVLVDGKIYTTVAQAAEVATSTSTVTLLHNSTETIEFPMGVTLEKNGFEANGVTVVVPVAQIGEVKYETFQAALKAIGSGDVVINLLKDVTMDITAWQTLAIGAKNTTSITIDGENGDNDFTLTFNKLNSDWNHIATSNDNATKLILKNLKLADSGKNNGPWNRYDHNFACNVELTNVVSNKALAFKAGATLNNVTINETGDNYAIWIQPNGQDVNINGLTVVSAGRGIKIDNQYVDNAQLVNLSVTKAKFETVKKAAIVVKSPAGANIVAENVDITKVAADSRNLVWVDEDGATDFGMVTLTGGTVAQEGIKGFVAAITKGANVEGYYKTLQKALNDAVAGTGNVTVTILKDINLTGIDWNPVTVSAPGYPVVTVEGNNKTITGLNDMLFAATWAGNSGLIIKNLTIENSTIENDKNDAAGNVGVGAFVGFPQASSVITLENCHLVNSTVEGGHWTGGLIGYAAGYAGTDGPVFMNLTVNNCSVKESTITGKGSVGGIIGHGSGNAWTMVEIQGTEVSGNTITSTGSSDNKAGAVMGTIGAAGQATTVNGVEKQGGALVAATVSGNTVKSNGTAITTIYGRQGTNTGVLELNGGSYDNYPIEEGVAYAAPAEGYKIVKNANNTYGIEEDPAYGKVAKIGDNYYETLAEAIDAIDSGDVVIELLDNATLNYGAREAYGTAETKSLTINGNDNVLTLNQTNSDWSSFGLANADAKVVFNNMTIKKTGYGDTSGAWNTHAIIFSCPLEMTKVTVNNGIAVQAGATLNNVTINEANGYYGLWINGNGQSVTMNGGSINATNGGRGIKIADQYIDAPEKVTLNVTGTDFNTAKKAAVLVSSKAGAQIVASNVDITDVVADKVNFVWVDEDWAANFGNVEVTGAKVAQEGIENFVAEVKKDAKVEGYYKTLQAAVNAVQNGESVTLLKDIAENVTVSQNNGINIEKISEYGKATAAEGSTITLLRDAQGAGIVINKDVTIDFNGHAYTFSELGVGSGTLTSNGFQILKGNNVTLKNGTLNVAEAMQDEYYILVQNYANLNVLNMTLDGTNLDKWSTVATDLDSYVLSNNSGNVNIVNTTITANDEGAKAFAFDVCKKASYEAPIVTLDALSKIEGKVELSGGQFYPEKGVKVSLTKEIDPYDRENESGWYTISAPFATDFAYNGNKDEYTLFRYDEKSAVWQNHKKHNFGIEVGRGYLYANLEGNDLTLEGVANVDTYQTILKCESEVDELKGNHLLGNPYTFDITGEHLAGSIAGGFYQMAGDGAWVPSVLTEEIAVGEGFLVQAIEEASFVINKTATETRSADNGSLQINVANDVYSDVAYVSFNEGVGLSKISHQNANIPMVYVPVENNDYAIAYLGENVEEVPFSFEAKTMGTYTISVKAQNCEFSTMTLVDRFTGVETNLLFEDYSFVAKSSDNSDRFILKLSRGTTDLEEEHFAYINNNGLIINNASGNATLQIFDVMGRPVSSHNVSGNANIAMESLTNGVYILRLIDDNNVRIQKVVID